MEFIILDDDQDYINFMLVAGKKLNVQIRVFKAVDDFICAALGNDYDLASIDFN